MSDTARAPVTLHKLRALHAAGEKIAMLTCYDASFARVLDAAGVDVLLVGDSLGMVLQGRSSTVPVTLEDMAYHTACVARAGTAAWLIADLPFGSYQEGEARCGGQVLVLHDLLGMTPGRRPRFVRDFLAGADGVADAVARYVRAVKDGSVPDQRTESH